MFYNCKIGLKRTGATKWTKLLWFEFNPQFKIRIPSSRNAFQVPTSLRAKTKKSMKNLSRKLYEEVYEWIFRSYIVFQSICTSLSYNMACWFGAQAIFLLWNYGWPTQLIAHFKSGRNRPKSNLIQRNIIFDRQGRL